MRTILLLTLLAFALTTGAANSTADSLSLGAFQIELGDGWVHRVEPVAGEDQNWGDLIRVHQPNGPGVLSLRSFDAPGVVAPEVLRNLTNVPAKTPLSLQPWGDYEGYQYDYVEGTSFYRQWWLANERTVVFVTYHCSAGQSDLETDPINTIVRSLRVAAH